MVIHGLGLSPGYVEELLRKWEESDLTLANLVSLVSPGFFWWTDAALSIWNVGHIVVHTLWKNIYASCSQPKYVTGFTCTGCITSKKKTKAAIFLRCFRSRSKALLSVWALFGVCVFLLSNVELTNLAPVSVGFFRLIVLIGLHSCTHLITLMV